MKTTPNSMEARDLAAVFHPATNLKQLRQTGPAYFERGEGIFVYDSTGRDFIEGVAGLWCASLGHGVEEIADAAREAMLDYSFSHLFGGRTHKSAIELAEKLKELAPVPMGKVFFGCSGSDANDTQVKLLRYYNNALGRPKKKKIIARERAYHGVTVASGSLTGLPKFHALFDLPMEGIIRVPAPYPYRDAQAGETDAEYAKRLGDDLEETILREGPETIAGFIAEPVMGVGGVLIPPKGYFERVRAICDKYDIILIDDEVICGFWRTGKCFGAESTGMKPDTITAAKALSSAYAPISAVMVPDRIYDALIEPSGELGSFAHGFTYSGHPVSCAVALKTLELYERWDIAAQVADVGPYFQKKLAGFADHPLVGEARGIGLVGALEFVADKKTKESFGGAGGAAIDRACREEGLILRPLGDTIAFCPPLIITRDEIDELFARFSRALEKAAPALTNG